MKIILAILSFILIISCKKESDENVLKSVSKNNQVSQIDSIQTNNPQTIDDIKKEFAVLNDKLIAKKLDSTGFSYNCEEIEGEIHFYYENQKLKMVKHFLADSHYSSLTKYYVKNGHIFFIFKDDTVWQFDGGTTGKPITKDSINQLRIYLQNNNPIKSLEKNFTVRSIGKNVDPETVPNKEIKYNVKELMAVYRSILKNKDKKGEIKCL
ncbi:hypothetical protein ACM39_07635 [Chryseobacterium sp. FH2]|uniref:hypothetical protein n=1 Tax=Chryseobacterium sp. FH2 TaxID=1674291 RepID=UPI00065AA26D|nr:hypothetical protein [Chryseobacterium sp. FH2]KMQ68383.1 hypothetical protein ACM39_07635 [Chryseobacterium sp. FH2]